MTSDSPNSPSSSQGVPADSDLAEKNRSSDTNCWDTGPTLNALFEAEMTENEQREACLSRGQPASPPSSPHAASPLADPKSPPHSPQPAYARTTMSLGSDETPPVFHLTGSPTTRRYSRDSQSSFSDLFSESNMSLLEEATEIDLEELTTDCELENIPNEMKLRQRELQLQYLYKEMVCIVKCAVAC